MSGVVSIIYGIHFPTEFNDRVQNAGVADIEKVMKADRAVALKSGKFNMNESNGDDGTTSIHHSALRFDVDTGRTFAPDQLRKMLDDNMAATQQTNEMFDALMAKRPVTGKAVGKFTLGWSAIADFDDSSESDEPVTAQSAPTSAESDDTVKNKTC